MSLKDKRIGALLKHYSPGLELELRFKLIDQGLFKLIFNSARDGFSLGKVSGTIEQSVNIITPRLKCSDIYKILYTNGVKTPTKSHSIQKCRLMKLDIHGPVNYRISLATEKSIDNFSSKMAKHIRLKYRASIVVDNPKLKDWRFDFTLVKAVDITSIGELQLLVNKMFPKRKATVQKFIAEAPWDTARQLEFEIEYVGDSAATIESVNDVVDTVMNAIDPDINNKMKLQEYIFKTAKYIVEPNLRRFYRSYGLKRLANQPTVLTGENYYQRVFPEIDNFYLTDKADGERCLVYVDPESNETNIMLASRLVKVATTARNITIVDAEYVQTKNGFKLYIFDAMVIKGKNISNEDFETRLGEIDEAVKIIPKAEKKPFVRLTSKNFAKEISTMYKRKRPYEIDGLIFTPASAPGRKGGYKKMTVYKWKPIEKLTIDFLIMEPPQKILGIEPYKAVPDHTLYFLFSGIRKELFNRLGMSYVREYNVIFHDMGISRDRIGNNDLFPIQFAPSSDPYAYIYYHPHGKSGKSEPKLDLSGHVGEFLRRDDKWVLDRMRPDRDVNVKKGTGYGNYFTVAESVWHNYFNPLTLEMLQRPKETYFVEEKSPIFIAPNGFNSFVKNMLIQNISGNTAVDLAAGKGQDLFRFMKSKLRTVLFIDADPAAIEELNRRKMSPRFPHGAKLKIYTHVADLTRPYKQTLKELEKFPIAGADAVTINFAIHYLYNDLASLRNLYELVNALLKPGGKLIFTCFNGQKVFDLLSDIDKGDAWNVMEGTVLKYSIRKMYNGEKLTDFGQTIAVKLPFSAAQYYEENLVNIDTVIKEFERRKYKREQYASFGTQLEKFKQANRRLYDKMTEDDKKYVSLYTYVSLRKP